MTGSAMWVFVLLGTLSLERFYPFTLYLVGSVKKSDLIRLTQTPNILPMPNAYHSYKIFPDMPHSSMVKVEGGSFMMESDSEDDDNPLREIEVSSFYLGQYPVSQGLWKRVMGNNPAKFQGNEQLPIEKVTWYDALEFCNRLSELLGLEAAYEIDTSHIDQRQWLAKRKEGALGYRLPTDAEWEYAARGGKYSKAFTYSGSNKLKEVAWNAENSFFEPNPVGCKRPNELGIYDMSGNVREWCADEDQYQQALRGGSWLNSVVSCRVSARDRNVPGIRYINVGFRVAGYLKP
ncbi:MAG: formylglycine-generating enzyme family protein [Bacteroidota bacterium]